MISTMRMAANSPPPMLMPRMSGRLLAFLRLDFFG
jgi:hypothetical protein